MFDTSKARIQQIWQEKSYSISALIFNTKIWNNKFTYLFLNLEINKQIKKRDQTHRKILNAIIQEIKGWMFNECRSFPVHCTHAFYDGCKEIAFFSFINIDYSTINDHIHILIFYMVKWWLHISNQFVTFLYWIFSYK